MNNEDRKKMNRGIQDEDKLSQDDMLNLIEKNRQRIRIFSNNIITVCGILIPASFLLLFFFQEKMISNPLSITTSIPILLVSSSIVMILALIFSALTSHSKQPISIGTKSSAILYLSNLYNREQKLSIIALILVLIGLLIFHYCPEKQRILNS
jgi:hypothetical protein